MANALAVKIVNVLAYVFLLGSNIYGSMLPYNQGAELTKTTYITPAPFASWIWTAINLLLLGEVVMQFFASEGVIVETIGWQFALTAVINAIFAHLAAANHRILAFVASLFLASAVSSVYWALRSTPPKSQTEAAFVHAPWSLWHGWSVSLVVISLFAAFGVDKVAHHAGAGTEICVLVALVFLASTAVGYAYHSEKGDVLGAATIVWTLVGIFIEQKHPALIHWFALGAAVVSAFAVVKAASSYRGRSPLTDSERAPLIAGSD